MVSIKDSVKLDPFFVVKARLCFRRGVFQVPKNEKARNYNLPTIRAMSST